MDAGHDGIVFQRWNIDMKLHEHILYITLLYLEYVSPFAQTIYQHFLDIYQHHRASGMDNDDRSLLAKVMNHDDGHIGL